MQPENFARPFRDPVLFSGIFSTLIWKLINKFCLVVLNFSKKYFSYVYFFSPHKIQIMFFSDRREDRVRNDSKNVARVLRNPQHTLIKSLRLDKSLRSIGNTLNNTFFSFVL